MQSDMRPVLLEVLAHIPTDFFHCAHCERLFGAADVAAPVHEEIQASYPRQMLEDAQRLAAWLETLSERYRDRLQIRIVDVNSPRGFLKALRFGVHRYPGFIINQQTTVVGWEPIALNQRLEQEMTDGTDPGQR